MKEIFKFADVKNLSEFEKIRTNINGNKEVELTYKRESKRHIERLLKRYRKYF